MSTTRKEHMEWCKKRALAYCDGNDPNQAIMSMLSDLTKHDETRNHVVIPLAMMMMMGGHLNDAKSAKEFIEGFE